MIELKAVTYQYPRAGTAVIRDYSAAFSKAEITAICGPNGGGKTTLTKLMAGILRPQRGAVCIDGEDIAPLDLFDIGQRAGYVFQNPACQMFCATVWEEVAYGLKNKGLSGEGLEAETERWLRYFRIFDKRDEFGMKLSRGEQQRVILAAVLALNTDYIIMDEPTNGLDMRSRHELGELLQRLKEEHVAGLIIVSHEEDFVRRYADREVRYP